MKLFCNAMYKAIETGKGSAGIDLKIAGTALKRSASLTLTTLFLLACLVSNAQTNAVARRTTTDSTSVIEEKLVALALKGPLFQGSVHQNKINEYQLEGAKKAWLNLLTISTNYNDQSFVKNTFTGVAYPKYFFGLTIPLGTFLSRTEINAAREGVEISKNNQEQLRRDIRADIISKYKQYIAYGELIRFQSELMNDVQAALIQSEDNFRKGTITIEQYNSAQRSNNDEKGKLINLQLQQDLLKLDIEKMIGMRLESVI
ncbi:MAG: TolC family protein [Chitinophagaceae bacterium]